MRGEDVEQDNDERREADKTADGQGPEVMTAKKAAKYLTISRAHFYKLVKSGRAPGPIRLGGAVRWRRRELDAWVEAGAPPRTQWDAIWEAKLKR